MDELRGKLADELATAEWRELRPHLTRDHLILLEPELDLVEVAWYVARDRVAEVTGWIDAGRLRKPSEAELEAWEKELGKVFRVLIVAPYVLIQAV